MQIPIHVAIPSYNNAAGLKILLEQLSKQNFASITVLDDASTDETQQTIGMFPEVGTVRSKINLGTVGANNLILRAMPKNGFLLCIDSDMIMMQQDTPEKLSKFLESHAHIAIGVGKIVGQKSQQRIRWNFNYDLNPLRSLLAFITYHPARFFRTVPLIGTSLRQLSCLFVQHLAVDIEQKVDWGIEGFFFVRCDLFKELGGFDERFKRFHEGPDLFLRLRKLGYEAWYTPAIAALDTDQGTGTSLYRRYHWFRSTIIYFYKHPSRLLLYKYPRP